MKDVPLSTQDSMGCGGTEGASLRPRSGDASTRRSGASNRPRAKFRNPDLCWRVRDSDSERPCRPIKNTEPFRIRFDPKLYRFRFSRFGVLRALFSSCLSGRKRNRSEFWNHSGIPAESTGISYRIPEYFLKFRKIPIKFRKILPEFRNHSEIPFDSVFFRS